jgi:RHS repeat-associated protein
MSDSAPSSFPVGEKGFVGGANDTATGLTNLGAREYQPGTGSFISPDPLLKPYDPQNLNAYAYAADNPSTYSDPSGAMMIQGGAEGCVGSKRPPWPATPKPKPKTPRPRARARLPAISIHPYCYGEERKHLNLPEKPDRDE